MLFADIMFKSLLLVLSSILLDFIFGVLVSIRRRTFSLSKLPQFLVTNFLPYVVGLVVLACLSSYFSPLEYLYYFMVTLVTAKFSKEALIDKIKQLF